MNGVTMARPRARQLRVAKKDDVTYWEYAPWVALVMLAFIGIRLHEVIPPLSRIRPVMLAVALGMGPLFLKSGRQAMKSVMSYTVTKLLLAYFVWAAFTVPFAIWQRAAFNTWIGLIAPTLMYLAVVLSAPTRSNLQKTLWGVVSATTLFLTLNVMAGFSPSWRLTSTGAYDPNDMGALLAVMLPLALGLVFRSRGLPMLMALGMSVVLAGGLVQTGSRGGVLAAGAGMSVFVLGNRGVRLFVILVGAFIGGIVAWESAPDEFRERMTTLTNLEEDYNTYAEAGRVQIWKRGLSYYVGSPLVGVGVGNFSEAEGVWLASQGRRGVWRAPHNAFVQAAADLGTPGIGIFLGLFLTLALRAKKMWRVRRRKRARPNLDMPELLASLAALATAALFLSMAYSWIVYATTGLLALADRVNTAEALAKLERAQRA